MRAKERQRIKLYTSDLIFVKPYKRSCYKEAGQKSYYLQGDKYFFAKQ